jgi:murein DD-endopeptidase MepM/ murein hydrolase activator NlpD
MTRTFWTAVLFFLAVWSGAVPRYFAPATLRLGSLNEAYVWDEDVVPPFTVEVRRAGAERPLLVDRGFSVDQPLSVKGEGKRPFHWSAALIGTDAFDEPGPVTVRFLGADQKVLAEVASEILPREFPVEEIHLNRAMSNLRGKPDVRKDKEAVEIWAIYEKFDPDFPPAVGKFTLPVSPSIRHSSEYGDTRRYLYSDGTSEKDYHRGTDFAVPVGTAVRAPAVGTVVLVASRMLTGTTVVLEHAPGLYTIYFHLSKALVQVGQKVVGGDELALSGATGFVTGPHLHWEVRCAGVSVDGFDLINNGLLDTERVSAVISSIEHSTH